MGSHGDKVFTQRGGGRLIPAQMNFYKRNESLTELSVLAPVNIVLSSSY